MLTRPDMQSRVEMNACNLVKGVYNTKNLYTLLGLNILWCTHGQCCEALYGLKYNLICSKPHECHEDTARTMHSGKTLNQLFQMRTLK